MVSNDRLFFGLWRNWQRGNNSNPMSEKTVTLKLNQQQLELLDRTIAQGVAPDRATLVRLALREYAAKRGQPTHE
jgi:metal-responsive CopG/Arc/MetJ family transcriptional regulator